MTEIVGDRDQFFNDHGRASSGFQDEKAPSLNTLRDGHFTFSFQQWYRAHLTQIHTHGIADLLEHTWRQIEFDLFNAHCDFIVRLCSDWFSNIQRGARSVSR